MVDGCAQGINLYCVYSAVTITGIAAVAGTGWLLSNCCQPTKLASVFIITDSGLNVKGDGLLGPYLFDPT